MTAVSLYVIKGLQCASLSPICGVEHLNTINLIFFALSSAKCLLAIIRAVWQVQTAGRRQDGSHYRVCKVCLCLCTVHPQTPHHIKCKLHICSLIPTYIMLHEHCAFLSHVTAPWFNMSAYRLVISFNSWILKWRISGLGWTVGICT